MTHLSQKQVTQAIHHYSYVADYLKVPTSETENQKLIELARFLKNRLQSKKNTRVAELLEIVLDHIEAYEKQTYAIKPLKPAEMLAYLMDQHNLTQSDLPEIGTQPHVSKILSGKRQLTREQISLLSKRFNVSPAVFYPE
jgi:HTH-type transcriptional regulator / antitoxin HigA